MTVGEKTSIRRAHLRTTRTLGMKKRRARTVDDDEVEKILFNFMSFRMSGNHDPDLIAEKRVLHNLFADDSRDDVSSSCVYETVQNYTQIYR